MKKEITIKYILDEKEAKLVKEYLDYCWHRITAHQKFNSGLLERIEIMRKEFNN